MDQTNLPNEAPRDQPRAEEPTQAAINEIRVGAPADTARVWNFGASVNPPQRAAPPAPLLQDVIARLTATAVARSNALRI